jgi:DNA-directed RNA polymerase specialized sigma24 family protein
MGNPQQLLNKYIDLPAGQCEAYMEPLSEEIARLVHRSLMKRETGDLEDFEQDCLLAIWTRISAIKSGVVETSIENIEAFVRRAVHNRYCDAIRRKRPGWYSLKLELLDMFSGKLNVKGLAIWNAETGSERLCGYAAWEGRQRSAAGRCKDIIEDQRAFARRSLDNRDPAEVPTPELIGRILDWCDGPVPIDDLVSCVAALTSVRDTDPLSIDAQREGEEDTDSPIDWLVDPVTDVERQVVDGGWLNHVLDWFWKEFMELAPKQRKAILFGLSGEQVMSIVTNAGIQDVADAIEMEPERFAQVIPKLPLPDVVTGEVIGIPARSVPSVRFKAWRRIQRRSKKSGVAVG